MNSLFTLSFSLPKAVIDAKKQWLGKNALPLLVSMLVAISVSYFAYFYLNGLGLAYNDARSHLDIGRRVVEGLTPGFAQVGSVWLPLPHVLMIPTVWSDFMWHSGLAGALQSMIAFVVTSILIFKFLQHLGVGLLGRIFGVIVFVANINVLYLQSTAMTELLLLSTLTAAVYYLFLWHRDHHILLLLKASFWIMMSTLVRYEGWFLLVFAGFLVLIETYRKSNYRVTEGVMLMFGTLAGFGIVLWLLWNQLIFSDALYFAFGPFSAHAQQQQLETAGVLATKGDLLLSLKVYLYALVFNSGGYAVVMGLVGAILFWWDKSYSLSLRLASTALMAPMFFNILALVLGHSVLFVQGISGDTWFNVRYGVMMAPSIAIFMGYLIHRLWSFKWLIIGLFMFVTYFSFVSNDAVTIDDARVGSSQKNVTEVSSWLAQHAGLEEEFILISVASHDAIIFSSELPMKRFIHEGTDAYWKAAVVSPDQWARWIIMRTYDDGDLTYRLVKDSPGLEYYQLVGEFPFADIYELKPEYVQKLAPTSTLIARHKKG